MPNWLGFVIVTGKLSDFVFRKDLWEIIFLIL